jgi:hypothetical protein
MPFLAPYVVAIVTVPRDIFKARLLGVKAASK